MKLHRLLPIALIALAGLSLGSGCPTFPSLKDRVVDLAVGSSATLEFTGQSTVNTHWSDTGSYDLAQDIDLKQLLNDANIDVSDVTDIKLSGVSYRVSVANNGSRTISNGTVSIQRQGGAVTPLVTNFTQNVGTPTPFATAPLSTAGTAVLNQLLTDILTATKNNTTVVNPMVSYTASGDADAVPYNFKWQLKIDISVVGKLKKITVLS